LRNTEGALSRCVETVSCRTSLRLCSVTHRPSSIYTC